MEKVKLGKYIHDLLLEHETVIVPGFGAFISEYKPAEISETEIKPPSRQISFSSSIRNNDGLLVGYVAVAGQVSHFDALKIIEKERDNIIFLLDKGEEVTLEEIGKLLFNEKNEITFTSFGNENQQMESFGLETVSLEKLGEEEPAPETTVVEENEEVVQEPEPVSIEVEDTETEQQEEVNEEISEPEELEPVSEINEIKKEVESNETSEIVTDSVPEETEPDFEPVAVAEEIPVPKEKKKKKAGWYWYLLILIPIVVAGFFVAKNISEKKVIKADSNNSVIQQSPQNENLAEEQPTIAPDSAKMVQLEETEKDSINSVIAEETKVDDFAPGEAIYYLVGGSFKDEENAKTYIDELKEKGFEPFYIGKQGNFYMVGIGKYKTEGQAVRARDTIWMKDPSLGLWVMKE